MLTGVLVEWAVFCSVIGALASPDPNTGFHEDFNDLDAWQAVTFSKIAKHTTYQVRAECTDSVLVAKSKRSASGIVTKNIFDIMEYPIICWRWKISNIYESGDMRRRSGDDYPMRICIVFAYDPNRAPAGTRLKYELVKAVQGEYPPDSSLNYVWANQSGETDMVPSPAVERTFMIPVESGPSKAGHWLTETRNVLEDYRRAFRRDPPRTASLAIMNDSDNTGEKSVSCVQFIELRKASSP